MGAPPYIIVRRHLLQHFTYLNHPPPLPFFGPVNFSPMSPACHAMRLSPSLIGQSPWTSLTAHLHMSFDQWHHENNSRNWDHLRLLNGFIFFSNKNYLGYITCRQLLHVLLHLRQGLFPCLGRLDRRKSDLPRRVGHDTHGRLLHLLALL